MIPCMRNYDSFADLLNFLLHHQHYSITVIVCRKREHFFDQALASISLRSKDLDLEHNVSEDNGLKRDCHERPNNLLEPTLRSIAQAGKTRIFYCTSIDSLRARLAVLSIRYSDVLQAGPENVGHSASRPLLLVLDLVLLHHGTSEFSVQGLSRTFAVAVESAARENMDLIVSEVKDVHDPENRTRGPILWQAQVPLLSESVKIGPEGSNWARRVIPVQRVAERWIKFPHLMQSPEQTPAARPGT